MSGFLPTAKDDRRVDALTLRDAADIIQARSSKPQSFWVLVIAKVLRDTADRLESQP